MNNRFRPARYRVLTKEEYNNPSINKFTKLTIGIPYDYLSLSDMKNKADIKNGIYIAKQPKQLILNITGKAFATQNKIGYIPQDIKTFPDILNSLTGIEFDHHYLMHQAPVYNIDIVDDFCTPYPFEDLFMTQEFYKNDKNKWDICKYDNLMLSNGFSIKLKTKGKIRFNFYRIYSKLCKSRIDEFGKIFFDEDFLLKTQNMIRHECQIHEFKYARNAFGLNDYQIPTIAYIFGFPADVLRQMKSNLIINMLNHL